MKFLLLSSAISALLLASCGSSNGSGDAAAAFKIGFDDFDFQTGALTLDNNDKVVFDDEGNILTVNGETPEKTYSADFEGTKGYINDGRAVVFTPDFVEFISFEDPDILADYSQPAIPSSQITINGIQYAYTVVDAADASFVDYNSDQYGPGSATVNPNGTFTGDLGDDLAIRNGQISGNNLTADAIFQNNINGDLTGFAGYDPATNSSVFLGNVWGAEDDVAFSGYFFGFN